MRHPKLRRKKVGKHRYWYTEANGGSYFGRTDSVSAEKAKELYLEHLGEKPVPVDTLTLGALFKEFLIWVKANRSESQYRRRRRDCSRFGRFLFNDQRLVDMPALDITGPMMEAWRDNLRSLPDQQDAAVAEPEGNDRDKRGLVPQSLLHAETSIRHAFHWGTKHPSPVALLPKTFQPFAGVERTKVGPKPLTEAELLSPAEVVALFDASKFEIDQFRRNGIEKHIKKHGTANLRLCKDSFPDLLRVYYATGARTSELAAARVRDFSPTSKHIVLREHKRAKSQKTAKARDINVSNSEAMEILQRLCKGRGPDESIFARANGRAWDKKTVNARLHSVERIARASGQKVRDPVTIYDFRHLWISDALREGIDIVRVAKIAGTSVRMIETVYGHFRKEEIEEAQKIVDQGRMERLQKIRDRDARNSPAE
jgi:integrase